MFLKFETSTDVRIRNAEIVIRIRINEAAQRPVIRITAKQQHTLISTRLPFARIFMFLRTIHTLKVTSALHYVHGRTGFYNVKNLVPETIVAAP